MGFSSEVHSKPLNFLKRCDAMSQKAIQSFLEHTDIPEYTTQQVKDRSAPILKSKIGLWWERPKHFKSSFLILKEGESAIFVNPRAPDQCSTSRIPLLREAVAKKGPIVMEAYLDSNDRIVWLADILSMKGENLHKTKGFLDRYRILQDVVKTCIQPHAVLQSCEVKIVEWKKLSEFADWSPQPRIDVEFQPLDPGYRRFIWRSESHEVRPKMNQECAIVDEPVSPPLKPMMPVTSVITTNKKIHDTNLTTAICIRDPKATGPDMYILQDAEGNSLNAPAIRSMPIRLGLRKAIAQSDKLSVSVRWYEPFNKYEVLSIKM